MSEDIKNSTSWQKLKHLAQDPYDLSSENALRADGRIDSMICHAAGLKLMYSTQRITEQVLRAFQEFADQHHLVERFKGMKSGEVL